MPVAETRRASHSPQARYCKSQVMAADRRVPHRTTKKCPVGGRSASDRRPPDRGLLRHRVRKQVSTGEASHRPHSVGKDEASSVPVQKCPRCCSVTCQSPVRPGRGCEPHGILPLAKRLLAVVGGPLGGQGGCEFIVPRGQYKEFRLQSAHRYVGRRQERCRHPVEPTRSGKGPYDRGSVNLRKRQADGQLQRRGKKRNRNGCLSLPLETSDHVCTRVPSSGSESRQMLGSLQEAGRASQPRQCSSDRRDAKGFDARQYRPYRFGVRGTTTVRRRGRPAGGSTAHRILTAAPNTWLTKLSNCQAARLGITAVLYQFGRTCGAQLARGTRSSATCRHPGRRWLFLRPWT